MSKSQNTTSILKILSNYDIVTYDVENVNPNKKIIVIDSNKGKVLLQKYPGTSKQLWLAYNVFKTLKGNDVLKITNWYTTIDGAPFLEANKQLYYLTKYHDVNANIDVSVIDHLTFLSKWHYLSREIVYARDFADSLTTPRAIHKQIKEIDVMEVASGLKSKVINNLKKLNLYEKSEKTLTVSLPFFNIKRLVKNENFTVFQPWQQIFKWNWQVMDVASILCFFKYDNAKNIKESLHKYDQLNPLSMSEWRALPNLLLWNLCQEVNFDLVSDSYFDLYEVICSVLEDKGIEVTDKITLSEIKQTDDIIGGNADDIFDNYPDVIKSDVSIVVVNEDIQEETNTESVVDNVVLFSSQKTLSTENTVENNNNNIMQESSVLVEEKSIDKTQAKELNKKEYVKNLTWKPFPKPLSKE